MDVRDFLSPDCALFDVRACGGFRYCCEYYGRAAATLDTAADRIASELLKRRGIGVHRDGGRRRLPHARMPEVTRPFGMLVRLKRPIDFEAIDSQPVDIVFLLLLPATPEGDQLQALASVAENSEIQAQFSACVVLRTQQSFTSAMVQEPSENGRGLQRATGTSPGIGHWSWAISLIADRSDMWCDGVVCLSCHGRQLRRPRTQRRGRLFREPLERAQSRPA